MSQNAYVVDTGRAFDLQRQLGKPPSPTIVTRNPEYDTWIERAALRLCIDAGEPGVIPTPCTKHLSEARSCAGLLLTEMPS